MPKDELKKQAEEKKSLGVEPVITPPAKPVDKKPRKSYYQRRLDKWEAEKNGSNIPKYPFDEYKKEFEK